MLDEAKIMGNRPLCATALGTIDTTHCTTPNLGSRIRSSDLSFFDYPVFTALESCEGPDLQLLYDVHTTKATPSQLSGAVKCLIFGLKMCLLFLQLPSCQIREQLTNLHPAFCISFSRRNEWSHSHYLNVLAFLTVAKIATICVCFLKIEFLRIV